MILLFAVYDRQTGTYQQPFAQPTPGAAERVLRTEVNREGNMLHAYPEDYELWQIGAYDENTGDIVPNKNKVCACNQLKNRTGEQDAR